MGGPHARYPRPVLGAIEPTRKLRPDAAAEHAAAFEAQPLAGDDQHDPAILLGRLGDERRHRPLGGDQRHAMQVELRLGLPLAFREGAVDIAVERMRYQRRLPCRPECREGSFLDR